jgi:hypothetical protein
MARSAIFRDVLAAVPNRVGGVVDRVGGQFAVKSVAVLLAVQLVVGRVAAQSDGSSGVCPGTEDVPAAIEAVIRLLNQIQTWGVAVGLAAAAVSLTYAGLLVMRGGPEHIQRAKQVVLYTVFGIVLVLIAEGLVETVEAIICP